MIESLTPDQRSRFAEFVDRWTRIGLSCDRIDIEKATAAVKTCYVLAGLNPPSRIIVAESPLSAAIIVHILRSDSVRASVWDSVGASVRDSVRASVQASVRDSVWASVLDSVGASVQASVWDSVWDSVGASVRDSVGASVQASVRDQMFGSHDAGWLSFYSFFREVVGLTEQTNKLVGLIRLAENCGWWSAYENMAIIQHRHCELHRDARGRLHNPIGPAVLYLDGFCVSAWHGTTIPNEWTTALPRPEEILVWKNIEQRRAACEMVGWANILGALNSRIIDKNENPEIGELLEVDLPDSGTERFLKVKCGTGRDFILPVPNDVETARQANAWTYGLNGDQLNVEIRT